MVSGFSTNTPPLPGWGNWDCSKRNCPTGHNSVYGYTAKREIQRIVCNRDFSTHHDADMYFVLKLPFNNEESLRIYDDATADEIKAAIEYAPSIGNVTVSFPNFKTDNIATACSHSVNQANGGFLVVFDTENGDLDLMTVTKNANSITITEYQAGYNVSNVLRITDLFQQSELIYLLSTYYL